MPKYEGLAETNKTDKLINPQCYMNCLFVKKAGLVSDNFFIELKMLFFYSYNIQLEFDWLANKSFL